MRDRRNEILRRLRRYVGGRYVIEEDEEPDRAPRVMVFGPRLADPPDSGKGVRVLTPQQWQTVFGSHHTEGSRRGEWAAALVGPFEFGPFTAFSPPDEAVEFPRRHEGRIGMGSTPDEAVDDLRKLTGKPDLRWEG